MTSPLHGLRMLLAAAVLPAALAAAGCGPSYELVTRTRADKPESRSFPSKHHTLEIAETPSASSPEIVVRVQQQWFSLERRKKIEQQFKKFDEKTFEAVAGTQKETFFGRISDQQEWRPAGGVNVTFRVASAGKEVQAQTDDSGLARFSVSEFAEEWIEGR
ncbi:MAG: hypothetical protein MUC63_08965, partial [Planctomycetes bacterium]|nr:hypothetical protein [Planctomycetota bacterium]